MASADVVVLGGGPAGLAAAWRAALRGMSVVLLEREATLGGMAASFDVGGVRVDHGSHRLHATTDPAILSELQRLLGDGLQLRQRNGRIRLLGRWVRFPLSPVDALRSMPARFTAALLRDMALAPIRRASDTTYADVVRARLGPTMLRDFYGPYAVKLWGLPPEELSGEQAKRRIGAQSGASIAARALRRSSGRTFWYPDRGFGAIVEALADAATDAGVEIRTSTAVERVDLEEGSTAVNDIHTGAVWSTLPLPALPRLGGAPPEILDAAGQLRSRALVLLYLVLDQKPWTKFDAHYFPGLETAMSRISEPANYRESADDPADRTVLCAEIPCDVGDKTWNSDAESLAAVVADDLVRAGLPPVAPVHVEARHVPSAYPIYRVGTEVALARVDAWASAQPRLLTFGRQGLFVHDNTHHAMAMAWAAADAVEPGREWSAARERFRAHVVED